MPSDFKFTINFNDPDFDDEERDKQAKRLFNEMLKMDEVEDAERPKVDMANIPEGSKPGSAFLIGLLKADVNASNAKKVLGFLGDRLSGKTIELEVEGNGRSLKVSASSRAELEAAIQQAQAFIAAPA